VLLLLSEAFTQFSSREMEMVSWNRSKIVLVGQGRAGKTALARSMMGESFRETPSTIGGELFEREIREGSMKGGKLAEHKRPEKELEWMIAKNGMKSGKQKTKTHKGSNVLTAGDNSKEPVCDNSKEPESNSNQITENLAKEAGKLVGLNRPVERKVGIRDVDRDAVYKLIAENINTRNDLSKLTISLCDFGGQEVFNALHAFFMTRCGVYMLVFDMELFLSKDEKDRESCHENIKFWMNSIAMHTYDEKMGKTAPVALVGTRKDKVSGVESEKISVELKRRYEKHRIWSSVIPCNWEGGKTLFRSFEPKVSFFFPIDNTKIPESRALTKLLGNIEQVMTLSEEVKREIPMIWMKALDEIREKGKKEKKSFLWFEEVTELGGKLGMSLEEVSELLRYLYEMGVFIWIEEPSLREIVILDPIEYFVKPATRIICKHLASKKDPYATKHELPIHKECQRELPEDWKLMLEFGIVTSALVIALLKNGMCERISDDQVEGVMLLMMRFGLMIPIFYSETMNSDRELELVYFVPSILPDDPESLIPSVGNNEERQIVSRLRNRFTLITEFQSVQTIFLGFFLSGKFGSHLDIFSPDQIHNYGFLPNGLFDRFIARILSGIPGLVVQSNDTRFIAFKNIVRIDYKGNLIRFTNCCQQNMIKIEVEESGIEFNIRHRLGQWLGEAKVLIRECYKALEVKTLLPVNCGQGRDGFINFELLSKFVATDMPEYVSADGQCVLKRKSVQELQSRFNSQWPLSAVVPTSEACIKVRILFILLLVKCLIVLICCFRNMRSFFLTLGVTTAIVALIKRSKKLLIDL
jgi:GTPase SAR1 family protein